MLLDNMPHKCTIRRRVHTKGPLGGSKPTTTNEQANVDCWEQAAGDTDVRTYQKQGMNITHTIFFTSDPNVTTRHQILITERLGVEVASPVVLDVKSIGQPDASAGMGMLWKVMCDETTSAED